MDDDAKEVVKMGIEAVAGPVVGVLSDLIAIAGGDKLHDYRQSKLEEYEDRREERRAKRRRKIGERAMKLLGDSCANPEITNEAIVTEIAAASQDEEREELCDLWTRLLRAALDPSRQSAFRREFIDIAKQLEPLDAAALPLLNTTEVSPTDRLSYVSQELKASVVEVELAFRNLARLGLIWPEHLRMIQNAREQPVTTALGKQLLAAIA